MPHGVGFAERIITASRRVVQRRPVSMMEWLARLFAEYHLPRPAYAFAGVLIIGMLLGILQSGAPDVRADSFVIRDFMYDDGVAL